MRKLFGSCSSLIRRRPSYLQFWIERTPLDNELGRSLFLLYLLVLDALLCAGALLLGRHPRTLVFVGKAGAYLIPVVYCVIGVIVLVRSGTLDGLF